VQFRIVRDTSDIDIEPILETRLNYDSGRVIWEFRRGAGPWIAVAWVACDGRIRPTEFGRAVSGTQLGIRHDAAGKAFELLEPSELVRS
jgi:hypothetical protein